MADWDKISSSGNIEDRRGMAGTAALGGGLLGIVILVLQIFGSQSQTAQTISSLLTQVQQYQVTSQPVDSGTFKNDNFSVFASKVLGSNDDVWQQYMTANNLEYTKPRLVLFRNATRSGCGMATSSVGPHYCPADQTIYLDETFFEELTSRFGAKGGDVAQAYVIAHEVAHHAQNQLGIMDQVDKAQGSSNENELSIKLELQADCFAGVWANAVQTSGVLGLGEINEAIDAASAVGDDRIQKSQEGSVNPETWTHGSSQQRVDWFTTGFNSGEPAKCNTFR